MAHHISPGIRVTVNNKKFLLALLVNAKYSGPVDNYQVWKYMVLKIKLKIRVYVLKIC